MFQIDSQSRTPIYEQIVSQIEKCILNSVLSPNEKLISVRSLSLQMHLNPNTVQKAYTELDRKGVIYSSPGVGTFIAENAVEILRQERRKNLEIIKPIIHDFAISGIEKIEIIKIIDEVYEEDSHD